MSAKTGRGKASGAQQPQSRGRTWLDALRAQATPGAHASRITDRASPFPARLTGVIGDPVAHSRSPAMHNAAFAALGLDWCYVPLHVTPDRLEAALRGLVALGFAGANVTIPHKERAAELAAELAPAARATGAVNTLTVRDERLAGDNTDVGGLLRALAEAEVAFEGQSVVVLGAGGAARGAVYALGQAASHVVLANRTPARAEALAAALAPHLESRLEVIPLAAARRLQARLDGAALLVNATSVGMQPGPDVSPLPGGLRCHPDLAVLDLVYAPRQTRLLREAAGQGCRTVEGLQVLVHQGALSFEIWTGRPAPVNVMAQAALGASRG